jgi:DNA-binding CsgD family transcriptional regulator
VATIVKSSQHSRADHEVDLSRLNQTERCVLRLLGEGHTAKSVAIELDVTAVAVNERLREARRKTGVGSSRELARLLKAQENRAKQLGLGRDGRARVQFGSTSGALFHFDWKGPIAMTLALFTVLTAAAVVVQQPEPRTKTPNPDPIIGNMLAFEDPTKDLATAPKSQKDAERVLMGAGTHAMLRAFYGKVRSEARDPSWASPTERSLQTIFSAIPHVGADGNYLRVICASTVCEVAGTLDPSFAATESAGWAELNRATMTELNPHALEPETKRLRLVSPFAIEGTTPEEPARWRFLFYFTRSK